MAYLTNVLELVESPNQTHCRQSRIAPTYKHAQPSFTPKPQQSKSPNPPYKDAPGWKCSVYYYWWLYLRYNNDYRSTCTHNGDGPCSQLYADFGDIFAQSFRAWWSTHYTLFAEPQAVTFTKDAQVFDANADIVDVQIDLSLGSEAVERSLKDLHSQLLFPKNTALYRSAARYPVARRPVLMNLHRHLAVFKLRKSNPRLPHEQIADRVGLHAAQQASGISKSYMERLGYSTKDIDVELRRAKRKAIQHDLRCAQHLIEGVGKGQFPVRTSG